MISGAWSGTQKSGTKDLYSLKGHWNSISYGKEHVENESRQ